MEFQASSPVSQSRVSSQFEISSSCYPSDKILMWSYYSPSSFSEAIVCIKESSKYEGWWKEVLHIVIVRRVCQRSEKVVWSPRRRRHWRREWLSESAGLTRTPTPTPLWYKHRNFASFMNGWNKASPLKLAREVLKKTVTVYVAIKKALFLAVETFFSKFSDKGSPTFIDRFSWLFF